MNEKERIADRLKEENLSRKKGAKKERGKRASLSWRKEEIEEGEDSALR